MWGYTGGLGGLRSTVISGGTEGQACSQGQSRRVCLLGGAGLQAVANTGGIALEILLESSPSLRCSVRPELVLMLRKHCVEGQKSPLSLGQGQSCL